VDTESKRGSERILVVDDSEAILKIVDRVLGNLGYDILVEIKPIRALEIVRDEEIDLMLVDILMPEMNGVQLVKEVRALKPSMKALMMTGYSSSGILEQVTAADLPVLWKPFTPSTLAERVRELLDGAGPDTGE
jgi:CheY-like chemotaxis protein